MYLVTYTIKTSKQRTTDLPTEPQPLSPIKRLIEKIKINRKDTDDKMI